MAQQHHNNWACNAIRDEMYKPDTDAKAVARMLSTQPRFVEVIQEIIDHRLEEGYNPYQPGGDPAEHVTRALSEALVEFSESDFVN